MTHDHSHAGWRESQPPPGPASMLDIGGDIGAVVAELRDDTPSGELVACPRGHPAAHFHTGVHLRPTDDGEAWIAVFPDVVAGEYSLLSNGVEFAPFVVVGGEVTELGMVELPAALDTSC